MADLRDRKIFCGITKLTSRLKVRRGKRLDVIMLCFRTFR